MKRDETRDIIRVVTTSLAARLGQEPPHVGYGWIDLPHMGAFHLVVIPDAGQYAIQGAWNPSRRFTPYMPGFLTPALTSEEGVTSWVDVWARDLGIAARECLLGVFGGAGQREECTLLEAVAWATTVTRLIPEPVRWSYWDGDPLIQNGVWCLSAPDPLEVMVIKGHTTESFRYEVRTARRDRIYNKCGGSPSRELASAWALATIVNAILILSTGIPAPP